MILELQDIMIQIKKGGLILQIKARSVLEAPSKHDLLCILKEMNRNSRQINSLELIYLFPGRVLESIPQERELLEALAEFVDMTSINLLKTVTNIGHIDLGGLGSFVKLQHVEFRGDSIQKQTLRSLLGLNLTSLNLNLSTFKDNQLNILGELVECSLLLDS